MVVIVQVDMLIGSFGVHELFADDELRVCATILKHMLQQHAAVLAVRFADLEVDIIKDGILCGLVQEKVIELFFIISFVLLYTLLSVLINNYLFFKLTLIFEVLFGPVQPLLFLFFHHHWKNVPHAHTLLPH